MTAVTAAAGRRRRRLFQTVALMFRAGLELLAESEAGAGAPRVSTGWRALDAALRGGLRAGTLTELCGESGAGKTQLALHATAHNRHRGAVYVYTEGAFPSRRLQQLLARPDLPPPGTDLSDREDRIYIEQLADVGALRGCVRARLPALLARRDAALIVLDSVAAPFRVAYTDYAERAEHLRELGAGLLRLAREHRAAVLCLNQMTTSFPAESAPEMVPCLGLGWAGGLGARLRVSRRPGALGRTVRVVFAPDAPPAEVPFVVTDWGVRGASEEADE